MGGFVGETGFSRLILRAVSLSSAVGGIVAVSGIDYYAQQFYDYLFVSQVVFDLDMSCSNRW